MYRIRIDHALNRVENSYPREWNLTTTARVILFMNVTQMRVGDVGIDLRRVDRGVAEELLDTANVSPVA